MADGGMNTAVNLEKIANDYSLIPGRSYYFRPGHKSGLGGMTVYIPLGIRWFGISDRPDLLPNHELSYLHGLQPLGRYL